MTLDIDKIIENIEDFNADSMEYKVTYRKDGELYTIKMSIEKVDE